MPTVCYFHGFASIGAGYKVDQIRSAFPNFKVYSPNLPFNPTQVHDVVTRLLSKIQDYPLIFVGTSLGGFWANYFAHTIDCECILVNPCVSPSKSFNNRIGTSVSNYVTGNLIHITQTDIDQYAVYERELKELYNGRLVNLFLAKNDTVIDYKKTLAEIKYTNSVLLTENGGHRYETNWNLVIKKLEELLNQ